MAHYDQTNIPGVSKCSAGDTFQSTVIANADHWTFDGAAWVKTAVLKARMGAKYTLPPNPFAGYRSYVPSQFDELKKALEQQMWGSGMKAEAEEKLPPMTCSEKCGFTNEYVGKEHLINGIYVCRQCRPGYERKQRTLALQKAHEATQDDPYTYGPSWKDGVPGL